MPGNDKERKEIKPEKKRETTMMQRTKGKCALGHCQEKILWLPDTGVRIAGTVHRLPIALSCSISPYFMIIALNL